MSDYMICPACGKTLSYFFEERPVESNDGVTLVTDSWYECPGCSRKYDRRLSENTMTLVPHKSPVTDTAIPLIVICTDGGVISEVISDREIVAVIVDSDIDEVDEEDVFPVEQITGGVEDRYLSAPEVTVSPERAEYLVTLLKVHIGEWW